MAKSMREQGYSTPKIQSDVMRLLRADAEYQNAVAENTKAYKQEVKEIIQETVSAAIKAGDELVGDAGNMAWEDDLSAWSKHDINLKEPNNLSNMYKSFQMQTRNQLRNITQTTGFKGTILGTTGVMNMYQRSMDLAVIKLSTGAFGYDQVVKDLIHELSKSGLRSIDYASGRSYHLDTAARMIVRTAASQLAGNISMMNIEKTGQNLVYVDAHAGARPSHAVWQGKVYYINTPNKKYGDFYAETDYGSPTGLKGINCTHNFYPYWEGDPIPEYKEPDPVIVDGQEYTYYEATQEQRKMERAIRATKREIEARKALGYDTKDLRSKLRYQVNNYHQFSNSVEIRAKDNRIGGRVRTSAGNSENVIYKSSMLYRAKTIKDVDTLRNITQSSIIDMKSVDEIKTYFEKFNITLKGFDNKKLLDVQAVMAGVDDAIAIMPEAGKFISIIEYDSTLRKYGAMSPFGHMYIGPSGMKDYGTGAHETAHAYDIINSNIKTKYSSNVLKQARKNLGLRKNTRPYDDLCLQLTGLVENYKDEREIFAYGVETGLSGVNNILGLEIVKIIRSEHV